MTENETNMSIKYAVCVLESIGNGLTLSNENDREEACVLAIQAIDKVQQFEAIGTIEELQALKEKSVAKKPVYAPTDDSCLYSEYVCPHCYIRLPNFRQKYCQCGQKLD